MTNGVPTEKSPLLPKKRQAASDEAVHDGFNGASFSGAVFNLCTTVVGAGIMALPATVKVLGLLLGVLLIIVVALLTDVSIGFLLRFSRASESSSYGGVMGNAFGRLGRMVLQMSVIVSNLGILIVYMIILGDVLSGTSASDVHHTGILEQWFGIHWWNGRIVVLLVTTVLVLGPLVALKRVDSLRYTSALSVALAVLFVVVTAGIAIVKLFSGDAHMPKLLPSVEDHASLLKLFTVIPIIVTAYLCHFNVHSIKNELEDPSQMLAIVRTSLTVCSTVYICTSFFCYLLFGEQIMDDVLANFDTNLRVPYSEILCEVVRIAYVLHLILVFPLVFFALRLNLDGLLFPKGGPLVRDNKRFAWITTALIGLILLGASFIPSIWVAFQFIGTTAAVSIGFIFPAAIALRDTHGISTRKERYLSWFMIIMATVSSLIAISGSIYAQVKKTKVGSP